MVVIRAYNVMTMMKKFDELATQEQINLAMQALEANGMKAYFVATGGEAKNKVFEILPAGAEIMNMTSTTLDTIGVAQEINESGKYNAVRTKLMDKDFPTDRKRQLGAAADWTIGSVHALTEDGKLMIASNTGSQLGAYAYGSPHLIWVVAAQKIVKDFDEGMRRVYDYVLPLESERANKAYHITTGSFISKLLIFNREITPGRVSVIIVNEKLGF